MHIVSQSTYAYDTNTFYYEHFLLSSGLFYVQFVLGLAYFYFSYLVIWTNIFKITRIGFSCT